MSSCSVCAKLTEQVYPTNVAWANAIGVSEAAVRRHLKHGPSQISLIAATPQDERESTEESSDGSKSVTAIRDRPVTLQDARDWIASSGDNPDAYTLSIRAIAYGADMFSNRMSATPKHGYAAPIAPVDVDPIELLQRLRGDQPTAVPPTFAVDESTFGISINDIQLGQSFNGGSTQTIEDFHRRIEQAKTRIHELRLIGRPISTLLIVGGGDIIEGCTIYPNMSFSLDMDRKQQVEASVGLLLHAIDQLGPLFARIKVLAAKGNHGENRINGNYTTLSDNDDTHVFEMAKLALSRDPAYMDRIDWTIAEDEAGIVTNVEGWVIGTTHGNVYAKGVAGSTIGKKAQAWYKNMAMKRDPIGRADVLIGHHYHHEQTADWGACLWKQTRSQDRGSLYFEQTSGEYSEPGMLTWVTTPACRWQDEMYLY